jgi:hypothetical protein
VAILLVGASCTPRVRRESGNIAADSVWRRMAAASAVTILHSSFRALDGKPVELAYPSHGPTAYLVIHPDDCYSCANIQQDAWLLHDWITRHSGRLELVLATDDLQLARDYSSGLRLPEPVVVTPSDWPVRSFGFVDHPLIILAAADGTVLSLLDRSPKFSNSRPLTAFLNGLDAISVDAGPGGGTAIPP